MNIGWMVILRFPITTSCLQMMGISSSSINEKYQNKINKIIIQIEMKNICPSLKISKIIKDNIISP